MSSETLSFQWEDMAVVAVACYPPANAVETMLNMGELAARFSEAHGGQIEEDWFYDASEAIGILASIGVFDTTQKNVLRLHPYGWHLLQDISSRKFSELVIVVSEQNYRQRPEPQQTESGLAYEMRQRGELDHLTEQEYNNLLRLCYDVDGGDYAVELGKDVVVWGTVDYRWGPGPFDEDEEPWPIGMDDSDPDVLFGYSLDMIDPQYLTRDGWVLREAAKALGEHTHEDELAARGYFDPSDPSDL